MKGATIKGDDAQSSRPYPFATASEMIAMGKAFGLRVAAMKRANEISGAAADLDGGEDRLWPVMGDCIDCGLAVNLPGC